MDSSKEAKPSVEKSKQLEQRKRKKSSALFQESALQPDCSCICLLNTGLRRKCLTAVTGRVSRVIPEHKAGQQPFLIPIIRESTLAD